MWIANYLKKGYLNQANAIYAPSNGGIWQLPQSCRDLYPYNNHEDYELHGSANKKNSSANSDYSQQGIFAKASRR